MSNLDVNPAEVNTALDAASGLPGSSLDPSRDIFGQPLHPTATALNSPNHPLLHPDNTSDGTFAQLDPLTGLSSTRSTSGGVYGDEFESGIAPIDYTVHLAGRALDTVDQVVESSTPIVKKVVSDAVTQISEAVHDSIDTAQKNWNASDNELHNALNNRVSQAIGFFKQRIGDLSPDPDIKEAVNITTRLGRTVAEKTKNFVETSQFVTEAWVDKAFDSTYVDRPVNARVDPNLANQGSSSSPLVGVIDTGFESKDHGAAVVDVIQQSSQRFPDWLDDSVGTGRWAESLTQFVDQSKSSGRSGAIVNLSFDLTQINPDGSVTTRFELTSTERNALLHAQENGVIIVAAAGNQDGAISALGQASQTFDNIITVGASEDGQRADYASYGQGLSLVASGNGRGNIEGTSLSAAKVTAAVAKVWQANPDLNYRQVIQALESEATDLHKPGWDAATGAGLLDTKGAIDLATHTIPDSTVLSGAQLVQQVPLDSATWESWDGSVASERANRLIEDDVPRSPAQATSAQRAFELHRQGERAPLPPQPTSAQRAVLAAPRPNPLDERRAAPPTPAPNPLDVEEAALLAAPRPNPLDERRAAPPAPAPNPLDVEEATLLAAPRPNPLDKRRAAPPTPAPNPLDVAAMEQPNPTLGQVAIQQGDTLWDVAQEQLGSGDRWRELRKLDGSSFTEQEASQLQVGTSVQVPGALPDPIVDAVNTETPPPMEQPNLTPAPEPTPPAPPLPAPAPNHVADFFGSVGNKLWEAGEGVFETVTNPGQAVDDLVNSVHTIANDPGQALNSFAKPYLDAFNSGRYGDLGGQLAGDALLAVTPGGLPTRLIGGLRRLPGELPEPTPATIPSPSPTPTDLTPPSAPNSPALPPPDPAPDLIASIPDDVGNALREMGDGETLDSPPSSVPPAPQSGSLGNGDNISPQNPLTDGGGSPSSSGSELADPDVSSPPAADNPDRQLVTVGARDLEQTSSSPDRSTADSRNYEPVAVGGGNGGNRPSDPPTTPATPSATTRSDWADSPPPPQSGGSGGGNQPPQDPPIGSGGSPSSSDSEPDDPNKPSGTDETGNAATTSRSKGLWQDANGNWHDPNNRNYFARDPNKPEGSESEERQEESKRNRKAFMKNALNIIKGDKSHPLQFLIGKYEKWNSTHSHSNTMYLEENPEVDNDSEDPFGILPEHPDLTDPEEIRELTKELGVQAGHLTSDHSLAPEGYHDGAPERLALEDALFNWLDGTYLEKHGAVHEKRAIEIGGIPVEKATAQMWEELNLISKGTVESAQPHLGWTPG